MRVDANIYNIQYTQILLQADGVEILPSCYRIDAAFLSIETVGKGEG